MTSTIVLAELLLGLHLLIINFNLFGLIATPLGGWLGWRFVRIRWWRMLHLISMAVVALQAVAGRACFLTLWQNQLSGLTADHTPMIMAALNHLIYWRLPIWVFALVYVALCAQAVAMWFVVKPDR